MVYSLREICYYKTGGTCDLLFEPTSLQELQDIVTELHQKNIPYFLLGAGSNSLIMDEHWPGAVIAFRKMNKIERLDATTLLVQAGVENSAVAQFCLEHQLEGAAWMNRLPGQIGATVRMNARCYDGEISSLVKKVHALTPEGRPVVYEAAAIFLGYKNTIFQHNQHIIAAAEIALVPGEVMKIQRFMSDYASDREAKHQFDYPSCGCVFKNNYQASVPAGKLLDQAGVKNLAGRQTFISPHHANFVFNRGEATSREILELTLAMREAVYREFGVWLEYEMQIIGKVPSDLRQRLDEVRPQRFNEEKLAPLRKAFAAQQKKSEES